MKMRPPKVVDIESIAPSFTAGPTPDPAEAQRLCAELQPLMPHGWAVTATHAAPGQVAANVVGPWWDRSCRCGNPGCLGSAFYGVVAEIGQDVPELSGRLLNRILQVSWPEGIA